MSCPIASWYARAALGALALLLLSACGSPDERAQDHYRRGMSLLAMNDLPRARVELRNAIQNKADLVPAWRALAQIEEREQNWQAVGAAYRRIAAIDPRDIDVRIQLARFALLAGTPRRALEWANAASAIDDTHAGAIALRAAILLKLDDEAGATREAQRALEIDSGNVEAVIVLAAARLLRNDAEGALRILDGITAANKDDLGVALLRIKAHEKLGQIELVQNALRELIEHHPQQTALKAQLLQFQLAHRRWDEAEGLLRSIEAEQPDNRQAGLDVVRFLAKVKGPAAARQELERRLEAGGDVFAYQVALAELDFAEGHAAAAAQRLEAMIGDLKAADRIVLVRLRLAQILIATRDLAAAEAQVTRVLGGDGGNVNALSLRASIRLQQGRPEDAIADLRQALAEQPRSPELISLLALAYERAGSIELAERQFADAARLSDDAPAAALDYVAFLERRGNGGRAEEVLTEVARRHPGDVAVLAALAKLRLAQQNWAAARAIADTIRRLDDQRGIADQIVAASLNGQEKYTDSIALLEKVYAADPGSTQSMFALVRSYVLAREAGKAETLLDSVLRRDPANVEARVLKGLVEIAENAQEKAVRSLEAAIAANPRNPIGYRALAEVYARRGDHDRALGVLEAGLREDPTDPSLRLAQAGVLELKGDIEAAIRQYQTLLQEQPDSLIIVNNLASLLSEHRNDQASLEQAQVLARSLAKSAIPQFKDTLGWIDHLRGDHQGAIALLEEAAAELKDNPLVRYHLGVSYLAAGQAERGKQELRRAAELLPEQGSALAQKISAAMAQ